MKTKPSEQYQALIEYSHITPEDWQTLRNILTEARNELMKAKSEGFKINPDTMLLNRLEWGVSFLDDLEKQSQLADKLLANTTVISNAIRRAGKGKTYNAFIRNFIVDKLIQNRCTRYGYNQFCQDLADEMLADELANGNTVKEEVLRTKINEDIRNRLNLDRKTYDRIKEQAVKIAEPEIQELMMNRGDW